MTMAKTGNSWKIPWPLLLIFIFLSAGILALGYLYYEYQAAFFQREMEAQLNAIADLKVHQIVSWRQERLNDALLLADDPVFAGEVQNWFSGRGPSGEKDNLSQRLGSLQHGSYVAAALFDARGELRLSTPELKPELIPLMQTIALESSHTEKIILSDLYPIPQLKEINMSLAIPIHIHQKNKRVIVGVVVYQIDPNYFLYPLLQSMNIRSRTAEMVMVRRDKRANEILFLSELRHVKGAALGLRKSLTATQLPSVKAALGEKGIIQGIDYRGEPVLAATRPIPGSPWFLVAKIDNAEIFAPLRKRFNLTAFLLLALIASSGAGVAYFWRHREVILYRQQYEGERGRRALAQRYEYLFQNANDIILLMDQDLKMVEANERALAAYGYAPGEFLGLHLGDLYPQGQVPPSDLQILEVKAKSGQTFETLHRRRDGTTFPVAVSSAALEIDGNRLYQQIIRDMTKSKEREEILLASENQLRFLSSQLLMVQENERRRISKELHDELGLSLTVLKFHLSSIKADLAKEKKVAGADLQSLLEYLDGVIENVRRLSWDLSPGSLEELGLAAAVKNLLEEFGRHYELNWSPEELQDLNASFSHLAQVNIYRIFQESLSNIGRHAQASQITVSIKKQGRTVEFTVADDGQGFHLPEVSNREHREKGIGLTAMEERARLAGGTLMIRSTPGAGTTITFSIPIKQEETVNGTALSHPAG